MTILERILNMLDERDLHASDLCKSAGINYGTFNAWKNRGTTPSAEYIAPIADFFGVPERYILTGEGNPILIEHHSGPEDRTEELILGYLKDLNDLGKARALVAVNDLLSDPTNIEK